ncbi:MAG TPA: energy transducer TonB [Kofleriaceae bacterium]|nr:energy transducer TonB [Kofleriaceae bacterium]
MRRHVAPAAFVVGLLVPAVAAAGPASIVKGGPRSDKAKVEAALNSAAGSMGVCWRKAPPPSVTVKLAIAADGAVTATAASKTAAAQCAAGVLAVWTLPGGAWSGEVEITTGSSAPDLSSQIQSQLLAQAAPIKACQSQAPIAAGPVQIKMKIHPDGKITDVVVSSSLGAKIDTCVQKAVTALRIDPIEAPTPVTYQLAVAFAGKDAGGAGGPGGGGKLPESDPEGGSIAGGLPVDQVKPVMNAARPKIIACGRKGKGTGTVVTRFTIRPDGTTKNVVIKEAINDKGIEDCLVGVFKALKFPAGEGETKVQYPAKYN